ncbi:Hypothetical predicted protein, partial [Pelobates cultripes]
ELTVGVWSPSLFLPQYYLFSLIFVLLFSPSRLLFPSSPTLATSSCPSSQHSTRALNIPNTKTSNNWRCWQI